MKWYYWLGAAVIVALGVWYYLAEKAKVKTNMQRVREAKALKNVSTNLTHNEDVRIIEAENVTQSDEREAEKETSQA